MARLGTTTQAMLSAFLSPTGSGIRGWDLLIVGVWGVAGLAAAIKFFSWEPRSGV